METKEFVEELKTLIRQEIKNYHENKQIEDELFIKIESDFDDEQKQIRVYEKDRLALRNLANRTGLSMPQLMEKIVNYTLPRIKLL